MATLPKPPFVAPDSSVAADIFSRVGTPEFEVEYRRQMAVAADHDRKTNFADFLDVDWDALGSWE